MSNLLNTINESLASGGFVGMNRVHNRHLKVTGRNDPAEIPEESTFADLVRKGLNSTNQDQKDGNDMFVKMITDPESVEVHDVSIAMAKANMSLQITKSIVDRAVQAYKDIINMR